MYYKIIKLLLVTRDGSVILIKKNSTYKNHNIRLYLNNSNKKNCFTQKAASSVSIIKKYIFIIYRPLNKTT